MKKIGIVCLMMLLVAIIPVMGADVYGPISFLHVAETKYEPYPAEPARNLHFKLVEEFPFSLDPGEPEERFFGNVLSGQTVLVHFRVRVSPNAVEGSNQLKYLFKTRTSDDWNQASIGIMIKTHDIVLAVTDIETSPAKIRPGKTGTISIGLKNVADSLIKDLKARIVLGGIPLAPIGSTNEKMVQRVDSNEDVTVKFNVMAEPDAAADIYKLPLELEYADELGNKYQRNTTISVIIGDVPDLAVTLDSTTILQPGTKGEIAVKFVNKGVTDVKFLNVKIKPTDNIQVISSEEVYVGGIDSDDYETAEFDLFIEKGKGEIKIPLTVEYMDANNDEYTKLVELSLPLYSSKEAKKLGLMQGGSAGGFIIMLIIIGGAIYGYRKWKKKKAKKQQ